METAPKKSSSRKPGRKSQKRCERRAQSPAPPAPPTPQKPHEPRKTQDKPNIKPSAASSSRSKAPMSCASNLLRSKGNVLYKQASEGGFCFSVRRAKTNRALQMYTQALNASDGLADESASCYKNLGMAHWLSCKLELNQQLSQKRDLNGGLLSLSTKHLSVCKIHLLDTVRNLVQALEHGEDCKPKPWLDQIRHVLISIVEWARDQSSLLSVSRSPLLQYLCEAFNNAPPVVGSPCLLAYKTHADALFKEALAKRLPDKTTDYKGGHSLLQDCCVSLRRGYSFPGSTEEEGTLHQEMQELEESVNVHICICVAMQAITLGDMSLSEALLDEEKLEMEKVKDALDYFRQASLATRELDMETEAIAMSRLGKVYSDVLKQDERAHNFHFQSVRLALTVMSPSIASADWYKYSLERVNVHQLKVKAREDEEREKDRLPVLQRLGEKLAVLKREAEKGAESFVKYVYTAHPHPDVRRNVLPIVETAADVKASYKKAILHYHPDTNVQFGKDWEVLCEEICKHLNAKYERFKAV